MFLKPFKIRSQTSIKGSDRKKLRSEVGKGYSITDDDVLKELVPNKEDMTVMKIYTHAGESVIVYCLVKNPIFFEIDRRLFPTVYTLWKNPDLMRVFTTWPPVLSKMKGGADLMLPGFVVKGEIGPHSFGNFSKGASCCIKLVGNRAPVAVGKAARSGQDMYGSGMKGKGVIVLHMFQDLLWEHGDKSVPPLIEDPDVIYHLAESEEEETEEDDSKGNPAEETCDQISAQNKTDETCLENDLPNIDNIQINKGAMGNEKSEEVVDQPEEEEEDGRTPQERMDELLYNCCLHALKTSVKKSDLPLLTSAFFRSHMVPLCPKEKSIDVKKSSFKKLSKFLSSMQEKGLLRVKELSKGVESIIEIHKDSSELRSFVVPDVKEEDLNVEQNVGATGGGGDDDFQPPAVTEMFIINGSTTAFFKQIGIGKGKALTSQEVRTILTDYVKSNELQRSENKGWVTLDPHLSDLVLNKGEYIEVLGWDDLFSRCMGKMGGGYAVAFPGQKPELKKGKIDPIIMNTAQRMGNKKVTLVDNLETFGIDPQAFAQKVQKAAACSTSVSPLPGKNKGMQVMIQGNQINYVGNLLIEKYQIPRKFVSGLEKAPKSGKKKR